MGLFVDIGKAALNSMNNRLQRMESYRRQAASWDDETLVKRWLSASGDEKTGYAAAISDRGLTREDILYYKNRRR